MEEKTTKKVKKSKENTKVAKNKQTKKEKISSKNSSPVTGNEVSNLIKIVLSIIAIFMIFYGLTVIVTKNKKEKVSDNSDTMIQYDEILLGTLFEQPNSEYYVLVTKQDDVYKSTYSTYLSVYKSKEKTVRYYTANLDSAFNKSYLAEESRLNVSNIKDLKLKDSTLLKVKNKKIIASYEGNQKIIEHLESLIK